MKFRPLTASEIDCRVSTINEKGLTLLLYKDARVDMNILDETFGVTGWQRKHEIIGGNLYCTVSIWDAEKQQWISKQDVGVESYTEKEKGQASDSFKRACFNIGIGRELYTAPFIWIGADKFKLTQKNNKYTTYDKFVVSSIEIQDRAGIWTNSVITNLEIVNERTGATVYKMHANGQKSPENEPKSKGNEIICLNCKKPIQGNVGKNGVSYSPREIYNMTKGFCADCYKQLKTMNGGKQ